MPDSHREPEWRRACKTEAGTRPSQLLPPFYKYWGMQEAASHACGHEVQVKGELIWCDAAEDAGAPIWAE